MNVKRARALAFIGALTCALLLVTFAAMSFTGGQSVASANPHEFLSQFQGRQFPNERPPRDDIVAGQAAGIPLGATKEEVQSALEGWYQNFYAKKEKSGPNPIAYAERLDVLAEAESKGTTPAALDPISGTAKMLMIPFEFDGTDEIPGCDVVGGTQTFTATVTGPLHGTIPDPALDGDNNTIYAPGGDFSISWFEQLMFGEGVGIVRTDLNDGAGVDLSGVSATNWYLEQSEGLYNIDGDIYTDWIQLPHSVAWYGWDGNEVDPEGRGVPCDGTPSGYGFEFAIDTVNQLNAQDPDFDWAQYDVDGDGIVDHLMLIHAGIDNSAGGGVYGNYQLWAHSWDVYCDNNDDGDLEYGCVVDDGGTPGDPSDDIMVANYTHIPEDADIGVVVHEFGHDIGLPDYYDTSGLANNSTAHWINMGSGSWNGALGGSHPAPFNPWARYFFGWEEPVVMDYDDPMVEVMIGQSEPTPAGTEDSVWINLPDQEVIVENRAGSGKGLHSILGNLQFYTVTREFDLSTAVAPVWTFSTSFEIEPDWDYTYIRASNDGGANWDLLLNDEGIYATTDPNGSSAWLGPGGLTGSYEGILTYDLSAYAGDSAVLLQFAYVTDEAVQDPGIWIDDFSLDDGMTNIYSSDLEDVSDWSIVGWEEVPYADVYSHYYMLEWRNRAGSIAQVGQLELYYTLTHDQDGWLVDKFPANVPGLLVWYRNNRYSNNQAISGGREFEPPATGPKGELLVVDSHYDAIPWSGGWWEAGQWSNRRSAMDGARTLDPVPEWWVHDEANVLSETLDFGSRPAVPSFHDSLRSVPGWIYPGDGFVYFTDRAASVVIPAEGDYSTRIRDLDADGNPGDDLEAFWGFTVNGQVLGPGNPADSWVQHGLHVQVLDQAEDGSYGVVKIWNSEYESESFADWGGGGGGSEVQTMVPGEVATATISIVNVGNPISSTTTVVDFPDNFAYVSGTLSAGWVAVGSRDAATPEEAADFVAARGFESLVALEPEDVGFFVNVQSGWWSAGISLPELSFGYEAMSEGLVAPSYTVMSTTDGVMLTGSLSPLNVSMVRIFMPVVAVN